MRLEDLERHLTVVEEKLLAALLTATPDEEIVSVRRQADRELAPYRSKMSGAQIEQLQKLDIGIMPLQEDKFSRGKCGLKLLQYMAVGVPTVASPVGVNAEITDHGITGFSAQTEPEWHESLSTLIASYKLRASFGEAGRLRCEQHYSIKRWLPVLLEIFGEVSKKK